VDKKTLLQASKEFLNNLHYLKRKETI